MALTVELNPNETRLREAELRARTGKLRMRDVANELDVPEAALLEARLATGEATRLKRQDGEAGFGKIIEHVVAVGEVMALTRNAHCVHEQHGRYSQPKFYGAMGQVVGEVDLRIFTQHWCFGYAMREPLESGTRHSLQFFDEFGDAVHKIYVTQATDFGAFETLVADHTEPHPSPPTYTTKSSPKPESADESIDLDGFRLGWAKLEHSHAFYGLLNEYGVGRHQAMRLGGPDFVRQIDPKHVRKAFETCAFEKTPVMIFVSNAGCVQIHSGSIDNIKIMGPWFNILDPHFNLHLREDRISFAYVVRKPSVRGDVHAIELYDEDGFCFLQMFGERKPGETEREDWRSTVLSL
ncbi:MAG: ChuX/HutX family heme-like substrate-binding protein [Pseudomonadota bacterium]